MRILLVHRDHDIVEMVKHLLQTYSFEIRRAQNGSQAREEWIASKPDMVVIDTTLPDVDAVALCKELQGQQNALIVALVTPHDITTQVHCLEEVADAVLETPFLPAQLLAQIHALTRRACTSVKTRPSGVVTVGTLTVDAMRNVASVGGRAVKLTPTEGKLLHLLAANADAVCTSEVIIAHIWGYEDDGAACLIKSHVGRLRQKIEPDPSTPCYIVTIPGVGYMLDKEAAEALLLSTNDELPMSAEVALTSDTPPLSAAP